MKHIGTDPNAVTAYDDDKLQANIAMLGFKVAAANDLAKYNLQDQIIDEYEDATGIDAGNSTNERLTSGVYDGTTVSYSTPTRTVTNAETPIVDGDYTVYKWHSTGSYVTDTTQEHEYLIVGGGGSGGEGNGGGGGAGGVLAATGLSLTGGNTYTTTVGAGGAGRAGNNAIGNVGGDSILSGTGISTLTGGGGGYGGYGDNSGGAGRATNGNGGGAGYDGTGGAGNGAGFAGGTQEGGSSGSPSHGPGGGGGAAEVGEDGTDDKAGDGGDGVANDIIETGTNVYYAGGGGAAASNDQGPCGDGGNGGGGDGDYDGGASATKDGDANTGGGGGGAAHDSTNTSGAGGSGIVILRVLTQISTTTSGGDLTLQSTANTASSAATKADLIMLMENAEGTATINTDIKGYVTADGGSNWTEGTLVDEGSWGTNKKIYAFHDATVTSGTDMRYKITTHNQSGSKITKIHATSIGWKA